ncbi:hypothetical protein ACTXT7_010966 [Hymenolepis weldensis]
MSRMELQCKHYMGCPAPVGVNADHSTNDPEIFNSYNRKSVFQTSKMVTDQPSRETANYSYNTPSFEAKKAPSRQTPVGYSTFFGGTSPLKPAHLQQDLCEGSLVKTAAFNQTLPYSSIFTLEEVQGSSEKAIA